MPAVAVDGITTRYEVVGAGPPILMFSPGGFDSTMDSWRTVGAYRELRLVERLAEEHTLVLFDRRESGGSGGRVQRISWGDYVTQAIGLLDHLGIGRAHLMGGCVGCSTVAALAVARPERVGGLVLYSPAGGVRYRMRQHERFAAHAAYVRAEGMAGVVALARSHDRGFSKDGRVGPWVSVLRADPEFAAAYAARDAGAYLTTVAGTARTLFDRDTVPGAEPEDLLTLDAPALIVPGEDESHAPSAARYLQECLPRAQYWDVPVAARTSEGVSARILDFLRANPLENR
jgi:pimeloyl-ACP methyl ester carboxylesterase